MYLLQYFLCVSVYILKGLFPRSENGLQRVQSLKRRCILQDVIIHRILGTMKFLHGMGKVQPSRCTCCSIFFLCVSVYILKGLFPRSENGLQRVQSLKRRCILQDVIYCERQQIEIYNPNFCKLLMGGCPPSPPG